MMYLFFKADSVAGKKFADGTNIVKGYVYVDSDHVTLTPFDIVDLSFMQVSGVHTLYTTNITGIRFKNTDVNYVYGCDAKTVASRLLSNPCISIKPQD